MDTDEDKKLKSASGWQYRPRQSTSALGDEMLTYMQQRNRQLTKNAIVVDLWNEIIPPALEPF